MDPNHGYRCRGADRGESIRLVQGRRDLRRNGIQTLPQRSDSGKRLAIHYRFMPQRLIYHSKVSPSMKNFLDQDFLLQTDTARELYHEHAAKMPIIDYHCHLDPRQIAENHQFEDLTEIWLGGDHYKWRAMRANGIPEEYITGDKPSYEKFLKMGRDDALHDAKPALSLDTSGT